jgi:hypothetical protein
MYDTVSVLLEPVPANVIDCRRWKSRTIQQNEQTGERRWKRTLNDPTVRLTLLDDTRLNVEGSLPKALQGHNYVDLHPDQVPAAAAVMDRRVRELLGVELPSVLEMQPWRVDYCANIHQAEERHVAELLARYRDLEMPHKGKPVRGQSGSLSWARGGIRPKLYSKYIETGGELAAYGVLRYEVGVFRKREFLKLVGKDRGSAISLAEVLNEGVRAKVLGRYEGALGRLILSERELSDAEWTARFVGYFGPKRAMQLMGFCLMWAVTGRPTLAHVVKDPLFVGISRATIYRFIKDMTAWRDHEAQLEGRTDLEPIEAIAARLAESRRLLAA